MLGFKEIDLDEIDGQIVFPRQKGTAIWQFPGNATTGTLMAGMQTEGIRVLMEVDDTYLHTPDIGEDLSAWQQDFDRSGRTDRFSRAAHRRLAGFADGIIVSTDPLAELYGELNPNVFVCPNSIDFEDWPHDQKQDDGILRIGWAASHSHFVDAPLVRRALKWASEQKDVEVWVFGIGDIYRFPGRVKKVAWTDDQATYRANQARCDVMICPLNETVWSRYKSDVKALEAVAAGAWPIVSTATAYKPWHDRTMTCTTAKDWEQTLRWVIRHRDEIPGLAAKAREYVLAERVIEKSIKKWRDAVCISTQPNTSPAASANTSSPATI